jgi:lycopene beta-cyclase
MDDILVVGAGPAALAIAAALGRVGLRVAALAPEPPDTPWPQTYGVWHDEFEALGLAPLLGHTWHDTSIYIGAGELALGRAYALIDNRRLQRHLLDQCARAGMAWRRGRAVAAAHDGRCSTVTAHDGASYAARLVVDASGHNPALLQRGAPATPAYQAAYGIVGTFARPPVRAGQCVLMDYRAEHLTMAERDAPPTFLYAMDLGGGRYFVEETSLASVPGVQLAVLEQRLHRRLAWLGTRLTRADQIERCFFPMNAPMPDLHQPLLGFGAAAGLVHPASGYSVGASLRLAPVVAAAIAESLGARGATPRAAVQAGWRALWPRARRRKRSLYLFGLATLLGCNTARLQQFFQTFYNLPQRQWAAYLADTLSTAELSAMMLRVFARAPHDLRATLLCAAARERRLLLQVLACGFPP